MFLKKKFYGLINIDFLFFESRVGIDNHGTEGCHKKIQIMKDVNGDELSLSLFGVVLEVNERRNTFIKLRGT